MRASVQDHRDSLLPTIVPQTLLVLLQSYIIQSLTLAPLTLCGPPVPDPYLCSLIELPLLAMVLNSQLQDANALLSSLGSVHPKG